MNAVVERFVGQTPITMMVLLALQCSLESTWIDALYEQHWQSQYTRVLLFYSTVEIMSVVAVGIQPSIHAAAKACNDLPVSFTSLYYKFNHADTDLVLALVQGSAKRLEPVLQSMRQGKAAAVEGDLLPINSPDLKVEFLT